LKNSPWLSIFWVRSSGEVMWSRLISMACLMAHYAGALGS
jgi:hypothetical protein